MCDISDLQNPDIHDQHLYVAARTAGLYVLSLADPGHPVAVGHIALSGRTRRVVVADSIAYVADNAEMLKIVDVSDPADPDSIARVITGGLFCVAKSGDYVYVNSGSYIFVIDVSDPSTPAKMDSLTVNGTYIDVAWDDNFLYFAMDWKWLSLYDISTPAAPVRSGGIKIGISDPRSIACASGRCYVGTDHGLTTVYIGTEEVLTPVSGYGPMAQGLDTIDPLGTDFAFGTSEWGPCYVFEVSDPLAPSVVATMGVPLGGCAGTAALTSVAGRDIGLVGNCSGVAVFDLSDRYSPDTLCFVDCLEQCYNDPMYGWPTAMDADSNYASLIFSWVDGDMHGHTSLWVIDLSNPDSAFVASVNSWWENAMDIDGDYAYLAGSGGIVVLDVTDPVNPQEVSRLISPDDGTAITIDGTHGYAGYEAGHEGPYYLEIFSAADPESLEVLGSISLPAQAEDIDIVGGLAYVSDFYGGLVVCEVTDPYNPALVGVLYTGDRVYQTCPGDGCMLIAADDEGLLIAPLCCSLSGVPVNGERNEPQDVTVHALVRAHPNPFRQFTRLSFSLAGKGRAELSVYDVRGAKIADVFDGRLPAGRHAAMFDGTGLAPGVYFTVLDIGGRRTTNKIVRLK